MSVWFCSDLHFGHKNIGKFRAPYVYDEEDNRRRIIKDWCGSVTKCDRVYVLGDAAVSEETLEELGSLPGEKYLVRGNHDDLPSEKYLKHFKDIYGLVKYKEFWLSHAPIHPLELRGKVNLHGHVHFESIPDRRYFNCCPENLWKITGNSLISLEQVRKKIELSKIVVDSSI